MGDIDTDDARDVDRSRTSAFSPIPSAPAQGHHEAVDHDAVRRLGRSGWLWCALAGVVLVAVTSALPWRDTDLVLGAPMRAVMAAAGVTLLVLVALRPPTGERSTVVATGALGCAVLGYPSLLALAGADVGGPVVAVAATAGHVPALTLVQLVPVLAGSRATGRSLRGWVIAIGVVAVVGATATAVALAGAPGAAVLAGIATVLWFSSFALAPVATWTNVRGTAGETRRRAILAALSALLPVVIIVWCVALGVLGPALGWSTDGQVTALMAGLSAATLGCGVLALGAVSPRSPLLRTRTLVAALDVLVAAVVVVAGSVVAVLASTTTLTVGWAVLIGAAVAVIVGLPWLRLHSWTHRVVDPASELASALAATDVLGQHRATVLHVIRGLVDDPGLTIGYGHDVGGNGVVLARDHGRATVVAYPTTAAATDHLARLGDCSAVLAPAAQEARADDAVRRAQSAAERERTRLHQDLHDGLQGRLLGLALHLQLSGRHLEDPAARLLLERAVEGLRSAVDDVRALGGGELPRLLTDHGLGPALTELLRPAGAVVALDLPPLRLDPAAEATAYFVVGEAVANALKHARAARIDVQVTTPGPDRVLVTVVDDGEGGADPRLGSGLRGLAERVSAAGGVLLVRDGVPQGTVVEAVLPCAS